MKHSIMSLLFAGMLLATSACSNEKTTSTDTPTDSEESGGNAGDNYMNSATEGTGDGSGNATTTMPSDTSAASSANAAGTDPGINAYGDDQANQGKGVMPHKDDPEFMKSAAHSDQNEIQLSRLVLEKGVTGMAKDHANMMITDHTKSTAELKALAQKKKVTLPTDMDAEHKALAAQMRNLSGKELEQRFLQQMVLDHQKTLNTMQAHSNMTQDAELKSFITKTTPVIQKHLTTSQQHAGMKM